MRSKRFRTILVLLPVVLLVLSLAVFGAKSTQTPVLQNTGLEGKTFSILGDSISTFYGISNNPNYNATLKSGAIFYPRSDFDVAVEDTWWSQSARFFGMEMLLNNSWSGSCLMNRRYGTDGAYINRCVQLHPDNGENAFKAPDIIAYFIGTNDYIGFPSTLGSFEAVDFDTLITKTDKGYSYKTPATTIEAYAIALHKTSQAYPDAEIYCFTILPQLTDSPLPVTLGEDIKQLAEHLGICVIDMYNCGFGYDAQSMSVHLGDYLHPNSKGMDVITGAFTSALLRNSRYVSEDLVVYDADFNLKQTLVEQGTQWAPVAGQPYEADLVPLGEGALRVSVTMGGEDVTAQYYADGKVYIPSVSGDLVITADSRAQLSDRERMATNFRWELDPQTDSFHSVTHSGNTANPLTMTHGSITDEQFSRARFTLSEHLLLEHNSPWVVEWKASGSWQDLTDGALLFAEGTLSASENRSYLYRRNGNSFLALGVFQKGKYHNYGVDLSHLTLDSTQEHVYRLCNRIADDGSNMVYLLIDGKEIGPMNHYYIAGTDQNKTVDWVNGKDFRFAFMGTYPHTIGGGTLSYVQVWEKGIPEELPAPELVPHYMVTYKDSKGQTLLMQMVREGDCPYYTGPTPTKDSIKGYHFTFNGWDKELSSITQDTVVTALFKAARHSAQILPAVPPTCTTAGKTEGSICSVCGYVLTPQVEIAPLPELKFSGISLTVANNLMVNFKVHEALVQAGNYSNVYVAFEMNGNRELVPAGEAEKGIYSFSFRNILAHWMNDEFTATLYATYRGEEYCIETRHYSVASYCYNQLGRLTPDAYPGELYDRLRTLLVDLLHYGAAMQRYTDYRIDAQVNENLSPQQLSYGTKTDRLPVNVKDLNYATIPNPTAAITAVGLELMDSVHMIYVTNIKDSTAYRAKIQCNDTVWWIDGSEFLYKNGFYRVIFDGLYTSQMSETVLITLYKGDQPVSNTMSYSIESYVYSKQNASDPELAELVRLMLRYGDSARAFAEY